MNYLQHGKKDGITGSPSAESRNAEVTPAFGVFGIPAQINSSEPPVHTDYSSILGWGDGRTFTSRTWIDKFPESGNKGHTFPFRPSIYVSLRISEEVLLMTFLELDTCRLIACCHSKFARSVDAE